MGAMGAIALTLAACGGGGSSSAPASQSSRPPPATQYSIGGSVSGLTGTGLVLQDNGGDNLTVSQNGSFTFATQVNSGAAYAVTVMTQPSGQTCTVASGSGMASANVTTVAVSCAAAAPSTVTIGGTVSGLSGTGLVLQDNGGDNFTVTQNGTFTFATALATGTAYAVTVATQPTSPAQTCAVANGTGTTASANVTNVTVSCSAAVAKFAYANDATGGKVYAFTIDPTTGALTQANVTSGLNAPSVIALAPNGKFAFTASDNGLKIHAFTVDQTTGALTEVAGSPFLIAGFTVGTTFPDIAVDANSAHLYIASQGDSLVAAFSIDPNSGALTQLGTWPTAGGAAGIPAFSPNGNFLYVLDTTVNDISGYSIDPTSGALTPIPGGTFPTGSQPDWIVFTAKGDFAYVANSGEDTISAYSVNSTTGVLTALSTPSYPTHEHPQYLTIDPTGTHLYAPVALGTASGAIDAFTINADGSLTEVPGSGSWVVGITPRYLAIDPNGQFAYVSSAGTGGTGVYGFSIDPSTGVLTPLAGNPFPTGPAGSSTAAEPQFVNIDPSGKYAYTADQGTGTITGFAIDPTTGALTGLPNSPYVLPGGKPYFVSLSPEAPGVRD